MKRKGIKNLIVDFGGVLIDLDRQRCLENFRELGLPDVEHTLDLYHQQDFFQKYEKGLITSAEFREVIRGKIGKPVTDAQIDDAWNSFLVSIPTFKLDLLLELRKKYVVYLLSNTNESIGNGRVCTRFATRLSVRRTFLSISISLMR